MSEDLKKRLWLYSIVVVLILSTVPFLPSLTGTPVWDDYDILKGDAIGSHYGWQGAFTQPFNFGYYRPVVSLSFQLDRALFGVIPIFYHQTNILIHLATVFIIVLLALRLFKSRIAALFSGILFGVQPIQASTVSWIGGRTDSLCALLLVAFLYLLVVGLQATKKRVMLLVTSAFMLFLAMMCKEQSALAILLVPPTVILLTNKEQRSFRIWFWYLAPFVFSCYVFVMLWVASPFGKIAAEPHTLWEQLALGGRGLWHYTILLLAPSPSVMHSFTFENSREAGWWPIAAGYISLVIACALTARLWRRRSVLALLIFGVVLFTLPVSNIIPVPSLSIGPYRVGIAGPMLAMVFGYLGFQMWQWKRFLAIVAVGAVFIWHFGLTFWASSQWKSEERFFDTVTKYDPAFYVARVNIAASYDTLEDDAVRHVSTFLDWIYRSKDWRDTKFAVKMWNDDPRIKQRIKDNAGTKVPADAFMANAFLNLGLSQLRNEQIEEGIVTLETAVQFNPLDSNIYTGIGGAYALKGNVALAEKSFLKAITLQVENVPAHLEYAKLLEKQKRFNEAETQLRDAVKWLPWHGAPYLRLARLLAKQGRRQEAVGVLQSAVKKDAMTQHAADDLIATMPEPNSVPNDTSGHPEH